MSVAWLLNRQSSEKDRDKFLLPFHYGWSFCAEDAWIHSGDRTDTSDFCASFVHFSWFFYIEFADVNLFLRRKRKKKLNFDFVHFDLSWLFFIRFSTVLIVKLHWIAYKCTNVVFFLKNFFFTQFFHQFLKNKKNPLLILIFGQRYVWRMLRTARKCPFRSCPIEYLICPYNCKDFPNIYF